ncbi:MAG: hypothetical protein KAS05_03490 [Candidatus Omnitrophica bacterium]|nr:hypothetical protein [Candidatus Omnitrophota bacterium]
MSDDYEVNQKILDQKKVKGYLNPLKVKKFSFFIITLCILFSVVVSILAIWDFAGQDVLYRTLATLGVIALSCVFFTLINENYG